MALALEHAHYILRYYYSCACRGLAPTLCVSEVEVLTHVISIFQEACSARRNCECRVLSPWPGARRVYSIS